MKFVTYNLNPVNHDKFFYNELSCFTTSFLEERTVLSLQIVEKYSLFIQHKNKSLQSFDEYYLEYLTLGVLLIKYSFNGMSSGRGITYLLTALYNNRNRIKALKHAIDNIRGVLSTLFLTRQTNKAYVNSAIRLKRFLYWLESTGEFSEETIRLKNWFEYITTLSDEEQYILFDDCRSAGLVFETEAKTTLGIYTRNLAAFREQELPQHRFKENYIFCGRQEVEYHLNMVGAEILNRAMKDKFERACKKVILFPTCMSRPNVGNCKAVMTDGKMRCTGCSVECNINIKRKEYALRDIEVALIPHSSGFTQFLEHWKDQENTALVGVACVLNLLKGGYEMQKLNIPSQCVFLDYCGCKKHWHKDGIPTNINSGQLLKVVGGTV